MEHKFNGRGKAKIHIPKYNLISQFRLKSAAILNGREVILDKDHKKMKYFLRGQLKIHKGCIYFHLFNDNIILDDNETRI